MDKTALAQQFNDTSRVLEAAGHKAVVRRTRALLESGDADAAAAFLTDARERLAGDGVEISRLLDALQQFRASGGDIGSLTIEPAWIEGMAQEAHLSRLIESVAGGEDLQGLVEALASQQSSLASGDTLPPVPKPEIAPTELPPLPKVPGAPSVDAAHELPPDVALPEPHSPLVPDGPAPVETPAVSKPTAEEVPELVAESVPVPEPPPGDAAVRETANSSFIIAVLLMAIGAGLAYFFYALGLPQS